MLLKSVTIIKYIPKWEYSPLEHDHKNTAEEMTDSALLKQMLWVKTVWSGDEINPW